MSHPSKTFWLKRLFNKAAREQHKNDQVVAEYRQIATAIGDGLSNIGLGDVYLRDIRGKRISIHDPELYHILDECEEAYASLGYRIIPLEHWTDLQWGVSLEHLWLVKREEDELPQFTKLEPKVELPKRSKLVDIVLETGKPHEAYRDENGDILYRELLGD